MWTQRSPLCEGYIRFEESTHCSQLVGFTVSLKVSLAKTNERPVSSRKLPKHPIRLPPLTSIGIAGKGIALLLVALAQGINVNNRFPFFFLSLSLFVTMEIHLLHKLSSGYLPAHRL